MKAAVYLGKERLEIQEMDPPKRKAGEVLLRVKQVGICGTDLHVYLGDLDWRVKPPLVMGHELCAEVVEAPPDAGVVPGDRVVVDPTLSCGRCLACRRGYRHVCERLNFMGVDSWGAFRAYWCVPQDRLHKIPEALDDVEGALVEPLTVAVHDVRRAPLEVGDRAVVIGGGPIGLLVALVARLAGAEVVVAEVNPFRLEKARAFGLRVVNPKEEDLKAWVEGWTDGGGADLVFEVSGSPAGARAMTEVLRVRGTVCLVGIHAGLPPVDLQRFMGRELSLVGCRVYEPVDFDRAIRIAASGELNLRSMVTDMLPLKDAAEGFEKVKRGGEVMKVLLDCQG
ncbi:MAG: Zn-dependent alcohol dehydrogenase [Candidatus Latescibacteria bacterium]|nr:Zn-dependent alcohol dehydrogenase [Candidatus Latescibacterota bacterium]